MASAIGAAAKTGLAQLKRNKAGTAPAAGQAATAEDLRAELSKAGKPVLLVSSKTLGQTGFLMVGDAKGGILTWATPDGATFTQENGVLIQTRGLGADLMSAQAPSVRQLLAAGTPYQRVYYFLGPDDQGTRRTYDCVTSVVGPESIDVLGRTHQTTHVTESCSRSSASGKLTNEFWIEGSTIRQSRQWVSAGIGFVDFARVID
ncbi:MAG TPA: YjbF family lipoprotein [Tabrizicola sp.]|nr:YjbF family lipoprotein [Tabrizicola sp.]